MTLYILPGKGWNILGNVLSPKVEQTFSRNRIEKIIEKLYSVFKKKSCIEQYVSTSFIELEHLLKYEDCSSMDSDLKYDFYLHHVRYPGTLIHYMQKRLTFRSKIWKHRKIITVVQQDLMRDSNIPPIDDVLCAHQLLRDFHNDKLPLSHRSKQMLAISENNEYTDVEIAMFSAYIPHYDLKKYYYIGLNNSLHPEYPKLCMYDGYEFPNLLYILHYEIFKLFVSDSEAFHLSFSFHRKDEWEIFLQRLLQEKFYKNCYEAMENIDMRIALLESKEFKNQEYFPPVIPSTFIDSIYKEIRNEMTLTHLQKMPCAAIVHDLLHEGLIPPELIASIWLFTTCPVTITDLSTGSLRFITTFPFAHGAQPLSLSFSFLSVAVSATLRPFVSFNLDEASLLSARLSLSVSLCLSPPPPPPPMQKRTVYNLQVTGLADGLVSTNGARTYNVRHFYSDFKKLHPRLITLARQFSQRFPPPMPDNGGAEMLLSSQMDSTVRRRQQVFNKILDYMIKTPGVNSDTAVMRFIGIQA